VRGCAARVAVARWRLTALLVGTLGAALACACGPSGTQFDDTGWWVGLAQPPAPADAWPLESLGAPGGDGNAAAGSWRFDDRAAGSDGALCHVVGADPWRVVAAPAPTSFDARLRARTAPGGTEAYGLAFRRADAGDYYLARVDTRNNNLRLYRQQAGATSLLAARDLGITVGQWHELAVHAAGPQLALALDGEPLLQVVDDNLRDGGVALWADAQTRVCLDGLWLVAREATDGRAATPAR
jgi:hypothetical protein